MNHRILIAVLSLIAFGPACQPLWAQEQEQAQAEMTAEQQAWMAYMTPGEPHQSMAKMVGKWKADNTFWMAPGQPPTKSEGTVVSEMILGGRYLKSTYSGSVWGMPMEGIAIEAYDNAKKMHRSFWIDNMGTGFAITEGKMNDAGELVMKGVMTEPSGGDVPVRQVITHQSDDQYTFKMYMNAEGGEFKTMEIVYTRIKDE